MRQQDFENVSEALRTMGELELTVAEFYQTCGERWTDHKSFWMDMEFAELKHADNIDRMGRILSERPAKFEMGRFITPTAIRAFIAGIKSNIERLKREEIDEKKVLFLGVDLEQSFLESNYAEIVKTKDSEFQSLMREINADTVFHREYLNRKLIEWTC
jgi:hypothetical protein